MSSSGYDIVIKSKTSTKVLAVAIIISFLASILALPLYDFSASFFNGGMRALLASFMGMVFIVPTAFRSIIIKGDCIKIKKLFSEKELSLNQIGRVYLLTNRAFSRNMSQQVYILPLGNLEAFPTRQEFKQRMVIQSRGISTVDWEKIVGFLRPKIEKEMESTNFLKYVEQGVAHDQSR